MSFFERTRDAAANALSRFASKVSFRASSRAARQLYRFANKLRIHDQLTGILLTRAEFVLRAQRLLRKNPAATLLLFDVDRLKHLNDALGFEAGDAYLIAVARTLQLIADGNLTARYGGDEFVVLVEENARAAEMPEQIRAAVAAQSRDERTRTFAKRTELAGKPLLTLSAGAVQAVAGEPLRQLLQRADMALCDAKNAGRDCVRWA